MEEIHIVLADDDVDDCLLTQEAFQSSGLSNTMTVVNNGEELLQYLKSNEKPDLILLDLNMPCMDGFEALVEIKKNPELKSIPIIILTTSRAEEDVLKSYTLGVSGFVTKPVLFEDFLKVVQGIGRYWFQIVRLPN